MSVLSDLTSAIADIKATATGKVEYSGNASLQKVIDLIQTLLGERGIIVVDNGNDLTNLGAEEAPLAVVRGEGLFYVSSNDTGGALQYAATNGDYWNLLAPLRLQDLEGVSIATTPFNGQVLAYNTSAAAFVPSNPTASVIGWANVTSKPTAISAITNAEVLSLVRAAIRGTGYNIVGGEYDSDHFQTNAAKNIFISPASLAFLTVGNNNVILNPNGASFTGSAAAILSNCVLIGKTADLSGYMSGSNLSGVVWIGANGTSVVQYDGAGNVVINAGGTVPATQTKIASDLLVEGDIEGLGNAEVTGTLTVGDLMYLPRWTSAARPSTSVAGAIGFNTDLNKIEYRGNSAWHQLTP